MKLKSSLHLIMGLAIVLSLLPALAVAAPAAAPASPQTDKIEDQLLDLFAVKGSSDFLVGFAEQADLSPAYGMGWDARGEFVVNALTAVAQRSQAQAKAYLDGRGLTYKTFIGGNELYVYAGDQTAAESLSMLPEVSYLRAPRTYTIDPIIGSDPAPEATTDWGIIDSKADQFWSTFGLYGEGITVANIDTGVQYQHPALYPNYKCGAGPHTNCWSDPDGTYTVPTDGNGHGTHTMGTMVAENDDTLTYIAGMAPNAQWIACQGCDTSSCDTADLLSCADWILAPGGSAANRPNIVNNSWGGGGGDAWYQTYVQAWVAAGIFPAFSAGNSSGCSSMGSPGDYQESFATTGHDSGRTHYYAQGASAFGHTPYTKPNISGPAVSVCSTVPTNSWSCGYSGTSMASPHTAGAVALLWSCNPSLIGQVDLTFQALQNGADAPTPINPSCGVPPDGEGTYEDGYGYLNIYQTGLTNCGGVALGHLDGYVYDTGGLPLEGASVTAVPAIQGIDAVTDPTGYYTMPLTPGTYDVTASLNGYTPQTINDVVIVTDTVTSQDFTLAYQGTWLPGPDISACFDLTRIDAEYFPTTGKVYILGGRSDTSTIGNIYSFDPTTGTCVDTLADMPTPISNYTINLINDGTNDLLCTFGGRNSAGTTTQDVQCYNPVANTAAIKTTLPAAWTGYTPGAQVVVDNKVYIFGGFNSLASPYMTARTDRYDPVANTFTQLGNLTLARSYILAGAVDGKIYAFGGDTFDGAALLAQTKTEVMADPAGAGTWNDAAVAELPIAGDEGRAFAYDSDSIYPYAGQIVLATLAQWQGSSLEVIKYDVATDTYDTTFPDLINSRRNHGDALIPICTPDPTDGLPGMWVFGGYFGGDVPPYAPVEYYPLPCATEPVASFTAVPDEGCAPLDVQFTDTSTGNPTEWLWDFGDGGTSTEQNPLYTYVDPGTFVVTLTATNAEGSDTATGTITVYETPDASFTYPAPVYVATPVQFTDTSSGTPVSWLWETSDGYSYNIQNPQHTFYTAGDFLVTLTVTNSLGCADTTEQTVTALFSPWEKYINGEPWTPGMSITVETSDTIEVVEVLHLMQQQAMGDQKSVAQQANTDTAPTSRAPIGTMALGDLLFEIDFGAVTGDTQLLGVEFDGTYYWVTGGNSGSDPNKLYKINTTGALIATYDQSSLAGWGWRDLAFDGTYLYASDSGVVQEINPATGLVTGVTIPSPTNPARALAYDPATDHFWAANWDSLLYEFDRTGAIINSFPAVGLSTYGMAWDAWSAGGPFLWLWSQDGPDPLLMASQVNPTTGALTGVSFLGSGVAGEMAGGAAISNQVVPGKAVFLGMNQGVSDRLGVYELSTLALSFAQIETWDMAHLALLDWAATGGDVTVTPGQVAWTGEILEPTTITLTKWFHVEAGTWLQTTLWEELWLNDVELEQRPVVVNHLQLQYIYLPLVFRNYVSIP